MAIENYFTKVVRLTVSIDRLDTDMMDGSTHAVYIMAHYDDTVSIVASWYGNHDGMKIKYEDLKLRIGFSE